MIRYKALYALNQEAFGMVYGPQERRRIHELVDVVSSAPLTSHSLLAHREALSQTEILLGGWGAPPLDADLLATAPLLKAVFYGAGSVSHLMTVEAWQRGITVSSAYAANAIPVAEYTLAAIIFSLKHGWRLARMTRERRQFPGRDSAPGCFGRTVGLVSLGIIARTLIERMRALDLEIIAYDPLVDAAEGQRLGVEMVSLPDLFRRADAVSIHTPLLPETLGMITGAHIASMKDGATLINTSRGHVVREQEMVAVAAQRPDLQFVLDVTEQEPPEINSPLYKLPNVVLTPHIAGSVGEECRRMGQYMVEELERFLKGEPLRWQITVEATAHSSHLPEWVGIRPITKPRSLAPVKTSLG